MGIQELLFFLLYGDGMVCLTRLMVYKKKMLDTLYSYCNDWKLFVNVSKTKKVVFKKSGRLNQNVNWSFNDEEI